MPMIESILFVVAFYLFSGFLFSVWFIFLGVDRIDPAARGSSVGFRFLILPGAVVIWPLLLIRCLQVRKKEKA